MFTSDRAQLAIRALCYLSFQRTDGTVPVHDLAEQVGVSEKNMESILSPMRISGLVQAIKGRSGGYRLGHDPTQVPVLEVLASLDSRWRSSRSIGAGTPEAAFLADVEASFRSRLAGASLQDVVDRYHQEQGRLTYSI